VPSLQQVAAAKNQHHKSAQEDARPSTRTQGATDAGLSERQRKTALRVAAVPAEEFEQQVESAAPPAVTQLAERAADRATASPRSTWATQSRGLRGGHAGDRLFARLGAVLRCT